MWNATAMAQVFILSIRMPDAGGMVVLTEALEAEKVNSYLD